MFKEKLLYIESEIEKVYQTNILELSVKNKLDRSLEKYTENLERTCQYLISQDMNTIAKFIFRKESKAKDETSD